MNATVRTVLARLTTLFVAVLLAAMAGGCATAQSQPQAQGWSRAELDQLLAPVALYPDALLAQLLIASTYPDEIVEAARWSRMHPELDGEDAVRTADVFDWDPSVKSLLAFPGLLQRMDENIDWTRELGEAVLAQEQDVMDAVQGLRRSARIAGTLASDDRVHVVEDGPRIHVAFASPTLVYLPYYDPRVVYGRWWWPAHPPVVWAPWPGYRYVPRAPGISVGFWWASGVRLSIGYFYGDIDWPRREVRVVRVDTWYVHRAIERRAPQRVVVIKPGRWHHEPTRRHAGLHGKPRAPQVAHRPEPQREVQRREVRQPEASRPQAPRPEPMQPEARRPDARQPDAGRPEARRPDPRQPEARRPDVRRLEASRPEARLPEPKQPEARRPDVRQPDAGRPEARRPDQRQPDTRQPEARQRDVPQAESRRPEARERAPSTMQPAPQRETRRADAQRPQPGAAQRDAGEPPRATSQRGPRQEARRPQPAREAQRPEPQRETRHAQGRPEVQAQPQSQPVQPAERAEPRPAPQRAPRNADDARERRPQG